MVRGEENIYARCPYDLFGGGGDDRYFGLDLSRIR